MLTKFAIDYVILPQHNKQVSTHFTDDPIAAEEFLMQLLLSAAQIKEIRHDGVVVSAHQYNRLLKTAAERIASSLLRTSLGIDSVAVKDRFGFAA